MNRAYNGAFWQLDKNDVAHVLAYQLLGLFYCYRESEQVVWFWEIVDGMSNDTRSQLVQFVTGTTRIPASGFAALEGTAGPCRFSLFRLVNE